MFVFFSYTTLSTSFGVCNVCFFACASLSILEVTLPLFQLDLYEVLKILAFEFFHYVHVLLFAQVLRIWLGVNIGFACSVMASKYVIFYKIVS